jgi:hypothetical protein
MTIAGAYAAVWALAAVIYHEVRVAGHRRDDQELVESAPVLAGAAAAVVWGLVLAHARLQAVRQFSHTRAGIVFAAATMGVAVMGVGLLLEAEMAADGRIEHEWLLFEPLQRWAK